MKNYIANIMGENPSIMKEVCPECPWRRINKKNPHHPAAGEQIFNLVKNLTPMSCHMTQREFQAFGGKKGLQRCRGIEIFRANVGIPTDMPRDIEIVFSSEEEALSVWPKPFTDWVAEREKYFKIYPDGEWLDIDGTLWRAGKIVEQAT